MERNDTARREWLVKRSGQVFTPDFLVQHILSTAGYEGVARRHVIDNSCGDGAFLCAVVCRYCREAQDGGVDVGQLAAELAEYVHGIELDPVAHANCLANLDAVAAAFGVGGVRWDVMNANALAVDRYDGRMDFVVGNPPYVRVHNLGDGYGDVKTYRFAQDGMTDLYLAFYELGLRMLAPGGRLCYITPSSWLASVAGSGMRRHIARERDLVSLTDLAHYQPFEGATAYTMIALMQRGACTDQVDYYTYDPVARDRALVDRIPLADMQVGDCFYVGSRQELRRLREMRTQPVRPMCRVKNGFATLADKVFIGGVPFADFTIPVVKASTGKWHRGFFPYDRQGKPLPKQDIFARPAVAEYLNSHKHELLKGKTEQQCPDWYLYGRTQALRDVFVHKYAVNTVVRDVPSVKITEVPEGSGLYSGLYIVTTLRRDQIEAMLRSDEFISYLRILKKYKSGGYYTYNSKDLEQYINHTAHKLNIRDNEQFRLPDGCFQFF